jgi:hypothetical protein
MDNQQANKLLHLIYQLSHGDTTHIISRKNLGKPLGWSHKETKKNLKILTKEGLIRTIIFNSLCITDIGVAIAEQQLETQAETSPENINKLIAEHHRRLQKLKEKEARFGLNTPPEILTEIEDIEAELTSLHNKLNQENHN